jgi:5,5'-dehydrodivanillate O-demethylase
MTIHLAWRVPIDDSTTLSFMVNRVGSFDEDMRKRMVNAEDYQEITRKVMECEMTLDEVDPDHPLLPVIQDTVTIGGQGVIADRSSEHLGQSDRGIALLRRIWSREMQAISEGKATTKFHRPADFMFREEDLAASA